MRMKNRINSLSLIKLFIGILIFFFCFLSMTHFSYGVTTVDMEKRVKIKKIGEKNKKAIEEDQKHILNLRRKLIDASQEIRSERWDEAILFFNAIAKEYDNKNVKNLCAIEKAYALYKKGKKDKAIKILRSYSKDDSHLAPLAGNMIEELKDIKIQFIKQITHFTKKRVKHKVVFKNVSKVQCSLFKIITSDMLQNLLKSKKSLLKKPVRKWKLDIKYSEKDASLMKKFRHLFRSDKEIVKEIDLGELSPGIYILKIEDDNIKKYQPFLVTDLLLSSYSLNKDKYIIIQNSSGVPIRNARVTLIDYLASPKTVNTGEDGLLKVKSSWPVLAVVESKHGPGIIYTSSGPFQYKSKSRIIRCYTYTDRSIYRPGHKVFFRGIIREIKKYKLKLPKERKVQINLKDAQDKTVASIERSLSKWGTFHGEFEISEQCQAGDYCIQTRLLPVPKGEEHQSGRTYFAVESFRRPEITIDMSMDKNKLGANSKAKVYIRASYFHRTPVRKAPITWHISGEGQKYLEKTYGNRLLTDKNGETSFTINTKDVKGITDNKITVSLETPSYRKYEGYTSFSLYGPEEKKRVKKSKIYIEFKDKLYYDEEKCLIKMHFPKDIKHAVLFMETDILDSIFPIKVKKGYAELKLPIKKRYIGGAVLHLEAKKNDQLLKTSKILPVFPKASINEMRISTDKKKYSPGQEMLLNIQTFNREQKPVSTEVSLGMVDKAIYAVAEETITSIKRFFYPLRRERIRRSVPKDFDTDGFPHQGGYQSLMLNNPISVNNDAEWFYSSEVVSLEYILPYLSDHYIPVQQKVMPRNNMNKKEYLDYSRFYGASSSRPYAWFFYLLNLPWIGAVTSSAYLGVEQQAEVIPVSPGIHTRTRKEPKIKYEGTLYMGRSAKVSGRIRMGKGGNGHEVVKPFGSKSRTFFPETAFWNPLIKTDKNGKAQLKIKMPDTITAWRLTGRSVSRSSGFSETKQDVYTIKDFFITSQRPRTLQQGDTTTISALIHTQKPVKGKIKIQTKGLKVIGKSTKPFKCDGILVKRIDWRVKAVSSGKAKIILSDQKKRDILHDTVMVNPNGMSIVLTAKAEGKNSSTLMLPKDFNKKKWKFYYSWLPDLHYVMDKVMKNLVEFPHGCVEQTMSRFMPDVVVGDALKGGLFNKGLKKQLKPMVSKGAQALYGYQNEDGGWGWFRENRSDPFMTSYVLWGLSFAGNCDYVIDQKVIKNGRDVLLDLIKNNKEADAQAYMLYSLATADQFLNKKDFNIKKYVPKKSKLSAYGLALMAQVHYLRNENKKAEKYMKSLMKKIKKDGDRVYFVKSQKLNKFLPANNIESTAYALRSIMLMNKDTNMGDDIVNWLRIQKDENGWRNTKSTAAVIYGLAEYMRKKKIEEKVSDVKLNINGKLIDTEVKKGVQLALSNQVFKKGKNIFYAKGKKIPKNSLLLLVAEGWTKADRIKAGGPLCNLSRKYRSVKRKHQKIVPGKKIKKIKTGKEMIVEISIKTLKSISYAVLEDFIPSGCEIIDMSWDPYQGSQRWRRRSVPYVHAESRDDRMVYYFSHLKPGEYILTYRMRGETPGSYYVKPAKIHEMYDTSHMAYSSSFKFKISK